jgi:Ca-activated chloride channel family protein
VTPLDRALAGLSVCLLLSSPGIQAAGGAPVLRILSPDGDSPALGDTEVIIDVESEESVTEVTLLVDGLPAGRRTAPPFVFPVLLGEENLAHRFEAEAITASGTTVRTTVVTPSFRVDEIVDLELQQVYTTVTDRRGWRVPGLARSDFRLFDDGREQTIVTFASGDIPFSAILLLDVSQSMQGEQIAAARAGARAFLGGMRDFDEVKVILFSTRLLAASDFSGAEAPLDRMIEEVVPHGGSSINDFVFLGLQRLERRSGRRVLVLLSDGSDVHSVLRIEQVAEVARQSQTQIYWLRLQERRLGGSNLVDSWRDPVANRKQEKQLEQTIRDSGGRAIDVSSADEIAPSFREVLAELRDQYALGYYPDRRYDDGRWRQIEIQVGERYRVQSRAGYLDLP